MMNKFKRNKAFTFIELIVVVAILGVLILLAVPKLLGYTQDAKITQIKNDVRAYENAIEIALIDDYNYIDDWETVTPEDLEVYVESGSLFDKEGLVTDTEFTDEYLIVESEPVKTKLNGDFILGKGGKVYYHEEGFGEKGQELAQFTVTFMDIDGNVITEENVKEGESVNPPEVDFRIGEGGDELEFDGWDKPLDNITEDTTVNPNYKNVWEWVSSRATGTYYNLDRERGYFKYVGTNETTVEIPHVIQGVEMTSYYGMFSNVGEDVTEVISTNEEIVGMRSMFSRFKSDSLNLNDFNTSNVEDMAHMFDRSNIKLLNLTSFDTSNVTEMGWMFSGSSATEINISSFDTSNVTEMGWMFADSSVTELDLEGFNTFNVKGMSGMFRGSNIKELDLSSFDTSNVERMNVTWDLSGTSGTGAGMFRDFKGEKIILGEKFTAEKVESFSDMFRNIRPVDDEHELELVGLHYLNTSNATQMLYMFNNSTIKTLDLSRFNTSNVISMKHMFEGAHAEELDLSSFNTSKVVDMSYMFGVPNYGSSAKGALATSIIFGDNFDTSNVTDMSYMFSRSKATSLDLSNFDTSNVTTMRGMFQRSHASELDLSSFDTSNVTDMNSMFGNNSYSLSVKGALATSIDLSSFDTTNVIDMGWMFSGSQASVLDLSTFDLSNVDEEGMRYMLQNVQATTIYAKSPEDISRLNTNNTDRPYGLMFEVRR